jgi:RimJ/RimL family protein N-acetyltransferase
MPGPAFVRGDSIDLHAVAEEDIEFLVRGRNHPDVRRWLPRSRPHSAASARESYESSADGDSPDTGFVVCADGSPVGFLTLFFLDEDSGRGLISAWFTPDAQEQGYGTEAVGLLVEYAFAERRLNRVGAGARADNERSRATLETLGFTQEGREREFYYLDGEYVDRVSYGLLAEEWRDETTA